MMVIVRDFKVFWAGLRSRSAGAGHFVWSRSQSSNWKSGAEAQFKILELSWSCSHLRDSYELRLQTATMDLHDFDVSLV